MIAGSGKPDAISLNACVGRVRARTITFGAHVIATENIATIRILRGQRSWLLFVIGALAIAGAATQLSAYGAIAIAGIGLGVALLLGNLAQKVERGLCIGTSDGRSTLIVSRNQVFLQRLLQLVADKVDTDDETLLATFDIANGTITAVGPAVEVGDDVLIANQPVAPAPGQPIEPTPPPPAQPPSTTEDDSDEALFADAAPANDSAREEPAKREPTAQQAPPPSTVTIRTPAQPERRKPFDPLLDSGSNPPAADDDWLSSSRDTPSPHPPASEGSAGRVLLALFIVVLLGASVFAAWYFTGQTGPATSISVIASPQEAEAATPQAAAQPSMNVDPEIAAPVETAAEIEAVPEPAPIATAELDPKPVVEVEEDFTPPAPIVARASGQRYRARPSMTDDVLAETRAGGEALRITGRSIQPDGEWYRVMLPDNRTAWLKASLTVPRALFAQSIGLASSTPGANFSASAPQILEPAEGAQLGGGPQFVLLAWSHRDDASVYIVEIESYDAASQRWIEDPLHRRATVEEGTELSEEFPATGAWRWRVRGVTDDGQQSQFSRWSAFGIRN